jgi:hypothetical protein
MSEWLTVQEVAAYVGKTEETIRILIYSNKIKKIRQSEGKNGRMRWYIHEDELLNLYGDDEGETGKYRSTTWRGVTVLKLGSEIRIIVEMVCRCGDSIPMIWQGELTKENLFPKFPDSGRCSGCRKTYSVSVPGKSYAMWWYLAKESINDCLREDTRKTDHLPANKRTAGNKDKHKKRKNSAEVEFLRQKVYGSAARSVA